MKPTKKEMAITIVHALYLSKNKPAPDNWKVKKLVRRTRAQLLDDYFNALKILRQYKLS